MAAYLSSNSPKRIGLAYATAKYGQVLPDIIANLPPTSQLWEYTLPSNDPSPLTAGYFYNARDLGMLADDVIFIPNGSTLVVTSILLTGEAQVTEDAYIYLQTVMNRSYCYFHGFAGNQLVGDQVFYDMSGNGNHAVPGANINKTTQMFANAGYISSVAPGAGATASAYYSPNLNFDYLKGEKIIVFYQLSMAAPAGNVNILGDGFGTVKTQVGIAAAVHTTGKMYVSAYAVGTAKVGTLSSSIVADGTLHDFAFVLDGENRNYGYWVDGIYDAGFGGRYLPFFASDSLDTAQSINSFNIGSSNPLPGTTSMPIGGAAVKIRSVYIYRLPFDRPAPSINKVTQLISFLRASPGSPVPRDLLP